MNRNGWCVVHNLKIEKVKGKNEISNQQKPSCKSATHNQGTQRTSEFTEVF